MDNILQLAFVAQSDVYPTSDQEVVGSNPARTGNILSWRMIIKYFLLSFSRSAISRRELSVSDKARPVNIHFTTYQGSINPW